MKKNVRLIAWMLALILAALPAASLAGNKDTAIAGVYETVMDKALQKALLLKLDATAELLKDQKGRAVAAALVSLVKAANEIEFDGESGDGDKQSDAGSQDQTSGKENDEKAGAAKETLPDGAYKRAAQYGEMIRDVDTQLIYCALLKKEGYDLTRVYPDGVEVDMDLRQYQPYETGSASASDDEKQVVLLFDLLIFSREDANPPELKWTDTENPLQREIDDGIKMQERTSEGYGYIVRLRVDLMQSEKMENLFADSLASCKSFIIIDHGYLYAGQQGYSETRTDSSPTTYHMGPSYSAFEGIYLISAADPGNCWLWDSYMNQPASANAAVVMDGSENPFYVFSLESADGTVREEQIPMVNHGSWYSSPYVVGNFQRNWMDNYLKRENGTTGVEALLMKYVDR